MNKKFAIVLFLAILCLSTNAYATQPVVSGVKAGDSFSYSINTHWSTTNLSLTSPPEYLVYNNQTKFYNVTVLYVEDVNVVAMNLWEDNNGAQQLSRVDLNIDNGTVYFVSGKMSFLGFFPADMNVGDLLRPSGNSSLSVNSTETWEYSSGKRDTNVVSFSYQVRDYSNSSIGTETITYYIDKATGVMVKRIDSTVFPDQTGSLEWTLTATNLWVVSAPTISLFEIAAIVVVTAAIIVVITSAIFLKKHRGGGH
jgi:hypothetical protein